MRAHYKAALALLVMSTVPVVLSAQEPHEDLRPGVAVFPFQDGGWQRMTADDRAALAVGLQQLLLNELATNQNLRIVERGILREILEEQDLAVDGRVDPATAARVGRIVGARFVVLPTFSDLAGTRPTLVGSIVSVETSEVLRAEEVDGHPDDLYAMVVDLAADVTEGLDLPLLPSDEQEARRSREIPTEALQLYSRAQIFQDLGRVERAIKLYQRISEEFPAMTEAEEALRQLEGA